MSPSKKLFYDDRKKTALRQPTHSGYQKLIIDYKHIMSSLDILSCRPCLMLNGVIYVRNNYEYFVSRHCRQVNRCPFIIFLYFFSDTRWRDVLRQYFKWLQLVTCTMMFPSTLRITRPR